MRKLMLILAASCIVLTGAAQTRTQEYLKKIPALPKDSCNAKRESVEGFVNGVSALRDQLTNEIEVIREAVDSHMESNADMAQENVMKQMSQMYGVSQADIDKMKNAKNMSDADKQALANKMMSQQTNMTMDEAKNLSKMSEAGRKAYAEAYAAEAMAVAKNDPGQTARNNYAGNLYETNTAQQAAYSKISEINSRIIALYSPMENDPERQKMLDRMNAWNSKLTSMMGIVSDGEARIMDSLSLRIKNEQIAYCNKYTLQYRTALRKHLQIMKSSMPEYKRFGDISAETTKAQTGIDMPAEGKELASLEAIEEYLKALQNAYRYKLYYSEDD
jgi:hypothetical protein